MTTLGEKFNAWLESQGKESYPLEVIELVDEAAKETLAWWKENATNLDELLDKFYELVHEKIEKHNQQLRESFEHAIDSHT